MIIPLLQRLLMYDHSSFAATEWIKGKAMDEALKIKNT
jgi:NifU-like protein involved in Fe-S cluster formation